MPAQPRSRLADSSGRSTTGVRSLVGAKWGAIVGRHQATWSLLERSIHQPYQASRHNQTLRPTLGISFASRGQDSNPLSSTESLQVRRPVRVSGKDGIYFDHRGEYRVGAEGSADVVRQYDELSGRAGGGDRRVGRARQLADHRGDPPAGTEACHHGRGPRSWTGSSDPSNQGQARRCGAWTDHASRVAGDKACHQYQERSGAICPV